MSKPRSTDSMKRWPRRALTSVALLALACPRAAVPPAPPLGAEPELRVGLGVSLNRVSIGGDGELFVTDDRTGGPVAAIPAGVTWTVERDTAGLRLVRPDGSRTSVYRGISIVNVTEGRFAKVLGRRYRGRVGVFRDPRGLTVVNRVPLEPYVAGVSGAEMGAGRGRQDLDALRAQAVVSRTFALRNRGRWESLGFDVYGDTRDQAYTGVEGEGEVAWDATRSTAGEVLRHDGVEIEAFFHSTCGYSTAGAEEAFRTGRRLPYLRPVSDERPGGGYYCQLSPRFRWRAEWDGTSLRTILSQTLPAVTSLTPAGVAPVTDIAVGGTTASGRVAELRIDLGGETVAVHGSDIRSVLRPEPDRLLGSTAFQLHVTRAAGRVTHVVAAGGGWGHGVGLCQWGAVGRARAGQDYRKILTTYFSGVTLARAY